MQIKSIVAGAAIALIAGVGSVSADEIDMAGIAANTGVPFALLDGITIVPMSRQELAATHGAAQVMTVPETLRLLHTPSGSTDSSSSEIPVRWPGLVLYTGD